MKNNYKELRDLDAILADINETEDQLRKAHDGWYVTSPDQFDYWKNNIKPLDDKLKELRSEEASVKAFNLKAGDRISISPHSDWYSLTVVSRTKYTLTCRYDRRTKFKTSWQDGEMECEQNPNGSIATLHWSKKHQWWHYGCYRVALGVRNYEDPSF